MKKIFLIISIFLIASCAPNWAKEEMKNSAKAGAASSRINASENNSKEMLKELDE